MVFRLKECLSLLTVLLPCQLGFGVPYLPVMTCLAFVGMRVMDLCGRLEIEGMEMDRLRLCALWRFTWYEVLRRRLL